MRLIQSGSDLRPEDRGASAAMGNFDGVHRGHASVIDLARRPLAGAAGPRGRAPLGVVTFEPHPRQVFAPDAPPFRLMNAAARRHRLEKLGVDLLFQLPFDRALASLTAEAFARDVLARDLGLARVVVGADFRFGRGREGDAAMLTRLGERHGFETVIAPMLADDGDRVSSTAIRQALAAGDPVAAARMLGHWHRLDGVVSHGDKRGRTLGFPTANVVLENLLLPRFGVYAVEVEVFDGPHAGRWKGAASLGVRPTFGVNAPNLETFLFDFSGDLYGREVSVALISWLRGEEKFDSVEALVDQMHADCDLARARLEGARVPAA